MDVIIDETGKMETLLIFDRRTGCDWSYDLIGGAGPFSSIGFYRGEDGEFHTNKKHLSGGNSTLICTTNLKMNLWNFVRNMGFQRWMRRYFWVIYL